jgi:hypothetical protein
VSEEQQNEIIGRTLKEYQGARKKLAALHAQAEYIGEYLSIAALALKKNHSLYAGEHSGGLVDLAQWPTVDEIKQLVEDINATQGEKNRRSEILKDAGFEQPS